MQSQPFGRTFSASAPENYERHFVPSIGAPYATRIVDLASLRSGERVLDVACGTGIVARLAAEKVGPGGKVVGVDVNPGMLQVARSVAPDTITFHEAGAEKMPLDDGAFDVVFCQLGLQFMEDPVAALREMHRVMAKDGRLLLNVPGPVPPAFAEFADALKRHVGPQAAGFALRVFSIHDTQTLTTMMNDAGLRQVDVQAGMMKLRLPEPREFMWQYVFGTPLAGLVGQTDKKTREALERDVVAKWDAYRENGGMRFDHRVLTATARK